MMTAPSIGAAANKAGLMRETLLFAPERAETRYSKCTVMTFFLFVVILTKFNIAYGYTSNIRYFIQIVHLHLSVKIFNNIQ